MKQSRPYEGILCLRESRLISANAPVRLLIKRLGNNPIFNPEREA